MKKLTKLFLILAVTALLFACNKEKYTIAVSKNYDNRFSVWIHKADPHIKIINLYGIHNFNKLQKILSHADGIIISGGEDVNPLLYHDSAAIKLCGKINPYRDSLEQFTIKYAYAHKIPLLGICRGEQIINVTFGGTLVPDIPTFYHDSIHRKNGHHTFHKVFILPNTLTFNIFKVRQGTVYSNHHQAVAKVAKMFRISAIAPDSVVEAIELKDTSKQFILGLQWHPEAMSDSNPLNYRIRTYFIKQIIKYHNQKNKSPL